MIHRTKGRRRRGEGALAVLWGMEMGLGLGPASLGRHLSLQGLRGRSCLIQPPGRSLDDDTTNTFC